MTKSPASEDGNKQRKKETIMSDKTKGALFLAISFVALIVFAFIIYAKLNTSTDMNEKVITVAPKKSIL